MKPNQLVPRSTLILLMWIIPQIIQAQIIINEVTAANYSGLEWGINEDPEDWVELKNIGDLEIDISGYWLSDDLDVPMKYEIESGTLIGPNQFYLFYLSDLDGWAIDSDYPHTNFNLTQMKSESIVLSDPGGVMIEEFTFGGNTFLLADHSYAKDEFLEWYISSVPTPLMENLSDMYNGYSEKPEVDLEAGYYESSIVLTLSNSDSGPIYYTLDGQEPGSDDILYTGPISIDSTSVLRARTIPETPDLLPGRILNKTYFIGPDQHQIQVVSISGPNIGEGDWYSLGLTNRWTHIEFFDEDGEFVTEATGDSNKHGHDVNAYQQRGFDFVCRDELGYNRNIDFPSPLFENSSERSDFQRLIFKCGGGDNYPFSGGQPSALRDLYTHLLAEECDMAMDVRTGESCVLYINGQYWGIYSFQEKVDDRDYMEYHHNQPKYEVDFVKTWGGTWNEMGEDGMTEWNDVVEYITGNDMSDDSNYDYVESFMELESIIDFFILNSTAVNRQWLNWDLSWWKGNDPEGEHLQWRYALWDTDNSWGNGINFTGIPNAESDAGHFDYLGFGDPGGQGHVPVINSLFNNDSFEEAYDNRRTDLQVGCLSCDEMIGLLDSLVSDLQPEMERHTERWGGSEEDWLENISYFEDFILGRCGEDVGIEESNVADDLLIYPNPTDSEIVINGEYYGEWKLIDLKGQQILSGKKNFLLLEIDLTNFESGIYIFNIADHNLRLVKL